jgi:hypothetical protein
MLATARADHRPALFDDRIASMARSYRGRTATFFDTSRRFSQERAPLAKRALIIACRCSTAGSQAWLAPTEGAPRRF